MFPDFELKTVIGKNMPEDLELPVLATIVDDATWVLESDALTAEHPSGRVHNRVTRNGEVWIFGWEYRQADVDRSPLSAIIRSQARVLCGNADTVTRSQDLAALNTMARVLAVSQPELYQGRFLEWAKRDFNSPYEAADELYHAFMGFLLEPINVWEGPNGLRIDQHIHWGTNNIAFTFTCKQTTDEGVERKLTYGYKYNLQTDWGADVTQRQQQFVADLLAINWLAPKRDHRASQAARIQREAERRFPYSNIPGYIKKMDTVVEPLQINEDGVNRLTNDMNRYLELSDIKDPSLEQLEELAELEEKLSLDKFGTLADSKTPFPDTRKISEPVPWTPSSDNDK